MPNTTKTQNSQATPNRYPAYKDSGLDLLIMMTAQQQLATMKNKLLDYMLTQLEQEDE